jgi:hypothetical protein
MFRGTTHAAQTFEHAEGHNLGALMKKPKTKRRVAQDRRRVAGGQGYEVNYFATKHGITRAQARDLISRIGNDRQKLNAAAERLAK